MTLHLVHNSAAPVRVDIPALPVRITLPAAAQHVAGLLEWLAANPWAARDVALDAAAALVAASMGDELAARQALVAANETRRVAEQVKESPYHVG